MTIDSWFGVVIVSLVAVVTAVVGAAVAHRGWWARPAAATPLVAVIIWFLWFRDAARAVIVGVVVSAIADAIATRWVTKRRASRTPATEQGGDDTGR